MSSKRQLDNKGPDVEACEIMAQMSDEDFQSFIYDVEAQEAARKKKTASATPGWIMAGAIGLVALFMMKPSKKRKRRR